MKRTLLNAGLPAIFAAAGAVSAFGQDGTVSRFEAVRGVETEAAQPEPAPNVTSTSEGEVTLDSADLARIARAELLTGRLSRSSREAFRRGLMPLADFIDQVDLADRTDLWIHEIQRDGGEQSVFDRQIRRWREVVSVLESFNQPNSAGWRADLSLARWALSDAEMRFAAAREDEVMLQRSSRSRADFARGHFVRRTADAEIGLAAPSEVVRAASILVKSPQTDAFLNGRDQERYLRLVNDNTEQTELWGLLGAGIGRSDRVEQARIDRDSALLSESIERNDFSTAAELLNRTEAHLQTGFDEKARFFDTGTASLYDLARTWRTWSDLHLAVAEIDELAESAATDGREQAYSRLRAAADATTDLRGRHAADVLFVDVLETVDDLAGMRRQASRSADYLR